MRCGKKLSLEVLKKDGEIREGFLLCTGCDLRFPIIDKIPILWDDFATYLSNRPRLGGTLYAKASTQRLKIYIKEKLVPYQRTAQTCPWWKKDGLQYTRKTKNPSFMTW
ncbi:hypothetical protein QVH35_00085 [Candidatus Nitrosotenuis chungbukensis]|uniref:hypothetical protein n=1 Tax=Candidatus Nitrosotenuis chungbukensis TaxID=1353246 RepID=UPI002671499D|nr:hypothetical protein [Candidatus Nitrosotenuis chungbukensis]WKT57992.1 hypothetical protein QVH35_00085 [Candidatus Nitrosotenuis chungbukensis]